eukprot:g48939.t1
MEKSTRQQREEQTAILRQGIATFTLLLGTVEEKKPFGKKAVLSVYSLPSSNEQLLGESSLKGQILFYATHMFEAFE